jgi:hypothetical protein
LGAQRIGTSSEGEASIRAPRAWGAQCPLTYRSQCQKRRGHRPGSREGLSILLRVQKGGRRSINSSSKPSPSEPPPSPRCRPQSGPTGVNILFRQRGRAALAIGTRTTTALDDNGAVVRLGYLEARWACLGPARREAMRRLSCACFRRAGRSRAGAVVGSRLGDARAGAGLARLRARSCFAGASRWPSDGFSRSPARWGAGGGRVAGAIRYFAHLASVSSGSFQTGTGDGVGARPEVATEG